jgi:HK97 gp10 family phage protein
MSLKVEVQGLPEMMRDVEKVGGNAKNLVKAAMTNSVNKIQSQTRSLAPHRTGTLQRSVLTEVNYPDATVKVNEKYGAYIESGTGIYGPEKRKIEPKTAKVLAFKIGGSQVFARSVKGMKAHPFFKPGIDQSLDYINDQFLKVIAKITEALAGKGGI